MVEQLGALPSRERQELLAGWSSFNLDENVGFGPSDPESFAASMERALGAPLGWPLGNCACPMAWPPIPSGKPAATARRSRRPGAWDCSCWA